jgi:dTDP-4-amino-4,6-dideoxygalactose transaminase
MNSSEYKVYFLSLKDITGRYSVEIHEAVSRVIDSGWYLQGAENAAFETDYARYIGVKHALGVANGLDALILILRGYIELGIMIPGDEVIVPANTFIASILAITETGLKPVMVEPDINTYQIDDAKVEAAITPKTKAIMLVHLYGRCSYTEKITRICEKYQLKLIEDNAQAHGCLYHGRKTGSLGDATGHSFYPGKNLGALGDGGMVTSNDDKLMEVVHALANYGFIKKYVSQYRGRNSRLDEIQAAVLDVKLKHLDEDNVARKKVARQYIEGISHPDIILPLVPDWDSNVFHIFPARTKKRDELQIYLGKHGIQTVIHYPIPPHKQECYREWNCLSFPITEQIHNEELSLPMSSALTHEQVAYIIETINRWQGNNE